MSMRILLLLCLAAPLPARADHPLLTEDTGVLGKGVWQLELHGEAIRQARDRGSAVLGFGIAERADLELEVPRDGDASLALKWRFYEQGALSMVARPVVSSDFWGSDLAAACELGAFELIGHLGYLRNRMADERESLWHASLALLWAATGKLKLVLDFARDTDPDPAGGSLHTRVLGFAYALTEDIDLGFGVKGGDERAWLFGAKFRW